MPLSRPTTDAPPPVSPVTIDRANLTGMSPGEAHEAILGALDAGVTRARNARGMIRDAVIDAVVASLTNTRQIIETHAPYGIPGEEGTFCEAEGTTAGPWPCLAYQAAADTIADGLPR